jgi:hypothetical protein
MARAGIGYGKIGPWSLAVKPELCCSGVLFCEFRAVSTV